MQCNSDTGVWSGEVKAVMEGAYGFTNVETVNRGGRGTDVTTLQPLLCGETDCNGAASGSPGPPSDSPPQPPDHRSQIMITPPNQSTSLSLSLSRRQSQSPFGIPRSVCASSGRSGLDLFQQASGFRPNLPAVDVLATTTSVDGTAQGCMWRCLEDAPGPVCRGFTFNANADPSSSSTACTLYRVRHGMPDGGGVIAERELTAADMRYTHYTMDKCQEPCVGSFADRTIMVPG